MALQSGVARLKVPVQHYDWGRLGEESLVALFSAAGNEIDTEKPYAELWMGTHVNGPAQLWETESLLQTVLAQDPKRYLTETLMKQFPETAQGHLPFLFKVLSIRKALSIQAHPDRLLAKQLFQRLPHLYRDPNHKPEMALALTPFEALCGFRPVRDLVDILAACPEAQSLVGLEAFGALQDAVQMDSLKNHAGTRDAAQSALRRCFTSLMTSPDALISHQLSQCVHRLEREGRNFVKGSWQELLLRCNRQFPGGDVGCFCVLFLNYIELAAGEAIFLGANEPHAYLSGDCMECMAASDNVVRAGLTPKLKDVQVLCSMLTYQDGPASARILKGRSLPCAEGVSLCLFTPPVAEFVMGTCRLEKEKTLPLQSWPGPMIFLVTQGNGQLLLSGDSSVSLLVGHVYFVAACASVGFSSSAEGLTLQLAYCNVLNESQ